MLRYHHSAIVGTHFHAMWLHSLVRQTVGHMVGGGVGLSAGDMVGVVVERAVGDGVGELEGDAVGSLLFSPEQVNATASSVPQPLYELRGQSASAASVPEHSITS